MIGTFDNTHLEYKFDLTSTLKSTGNRLAIIIESPERYEGQIYWTSKTKLSKLRFYYSWDWCPRIVQIGIWDDILLEVSEGVEIEQLYTNTGYSNSDKTGKLTLKALFSESISTENVKIVLTDIKGNVFINQILDAQVLINGYELQDLAILVWNPNGEGEQSHYQLNCTLLSNHNEEIHTINRQIGFRLV